MPTISIDGQSVDVSPGATVLEAARKLGIDIPALCYRDGCTPNTSCMVCLVKVDGRPNLVPSCATEAVEGMRVESETEEVRAVRRTALELLLSDHLGDCIGPCHVACPAKMDIPRMIRHIAAGRLREAIVTVKADIPLPAVLGRICPAPCEKACRRAAADAAVSICLLKRYVADADLAGPEPYLPPAAAETGRTVAVVGAGPAGLSAAYYLRAAGHGCVVFDERDAPGGMLRGGVDASRLPPEVLDAEIDIIRRLGAEFRCGVRVGRDVDIEQLRRDFDAVFIAAGAIDAPRAAVLGLEWTAAGARADRRTHQTPREDVFAAVAARQQKMAVRAVAAGKAAAAAIGQYLAGGPVVGEARAFSVHVGKLTAEQVAPYLEGSDPAGRVEPGDPARGFSADEAAAEARRCLHCDCRRADDCLLRKYAELYGAKVSEYHPVRRAFRLMREHAEVLYEPGKCIKCGLCVQITARAGERLGLTFVGRGFHAEVAVPLGRTLAEGLAEVAAECVAACPTAALAFRDDRA